MSNGTLPPDLAHAARFAELLGRAVPHAASLEEALAAVDLAMALPDLPEPAAFAFDAFHRKAQGILNRAMKAAKSLSQSARDDLKKALSHRSVSQMQQALLAWVGKYRNQLAQLLSATQLAALLGGAREVAAKLPELPPPAVSGVAAPPGLPPEGYTPDLSPDDPGRVQLPLIEEAAKLLEEKELVTRGTFDLLDAASRQKAFTVAGVSARETLEKVRDALAETVEEGADLKAFRDKVLAEVEPGTFLSDGHLETVFRGAVQGAFSDGQMGLLQHPVVRSGFPYATYDPIHDDRVRPEHLALESYGIDGTNVYRADDPTFQTFRPPFDFNCRCGWTPLSVDDAAARGVKEAKVWQETGVEPSPPAWVDPPPFRPKPGFARPGGLPLSIALSQESIDDFTAESVSALLMPTDDLVPATTDVTPSGSGLPEEPQQYLKQKGMRRGRKKLSGRRKGRKRWGKKDAALGLVGDEWHGPRPPGEGWVPIQPGPRGGKRWKRGAGAPPVQQRQTGQRALPIGARPTVEKVEQQLREAIRQGTVGDYFDIFATKLSDMTVKDITELKKRLGIKASGPKLELARKIVERARRESELQAREGPAPSRPYQRPDVVVDIDKNAPVADRIRDYTEGAEKVKRLASASVELDRWAAERDRLQGEADKLWAKKKTLASGRLGKREQGELDRLHEAIRGVAREENQTAAVYHGLLGREFAAADPPDLTYVVDDDPAAIAGWQENVRRQIAQANAFLAPLVERAGAPDTLPAVVKPLTQLEKRRAYYQNNDQSVHLAPDREETGTIVHEWGHHLEKTLPGASAACQEFLRYRMGAEKPVRFKQLHPQSSYDDHEEGVEDDFRKAFPDSARYVGKIYKGGYTEILSMGLEKLYNDPAGFARADPEYCAFVLGILDGRLRK